MHVLAFYFGIPYGAVWSNLIASALAFYIGIAWHRRQIYKHLNKRLDEHHEQIKRLIDK